MSLVFLQREKRSVGQQVQLRPPLEEEWRWRRDLYPDVLTRRLSSWPQLMIPAAPIPGRWEQVAQARLTIQGMGLAELAGTSCGPLSPFPHRGTDMGHLIPLSPPLFRPSSIGILTVTTASQLIFCPSQGLLLSAGRAGFIQQKPVCVPSLQSILQPRSSAPSTGYKVPSRLSSFGPNLHSKLDLVHLCPHRGFPPLHLCRRSSLSLESRSPRSQALIFPSFQSATQVSLVIFTTFLLVFL